MTSKQTLLIISQVYVPDPTSVGQHMHDAAAEMVRRGHRVTVLASARGFEDPTRVYPRREVRDGVEIRRFGLSSFGKDSIFKRLIGGCAFVTQAFFWSLFSRKVGTGLVSTSPPMCGFVGVMLGALKRCRVVYWVMDINPDQAVRMGAMDATSLPVKAFDWMNARILSGADSIVALDQFMQDTLERKGADATKIDVMPPWHHLDLSNGPLAHSDNPFRTEHDLQDRFVLMYSGNLSPVHPVTTILEAVARLQDDPRLLLLFVGGGNGRAAIEAFVEQHKLRNVKFLPYQPMERLRESLSAADVHLVSMGEPMVGVVHPCKIYGAMAAARPVLLLGPKECHVDDIIRKYQIGWQVAHGDVDGAERQLRALLALDANDMEQIGRTAFVAAKNYGYDPLCGRFCDVLESRT